MTRDNSQTQRAALPWSFPVAVAHLPDSGLQQTLEASPTVRDELAAIAGLNALKSATASFSVTRLPNGRVEVQGRVKARVEQSCVVTLEPVENEIDEPIDLEFAPPAQIPANLKPVQKEEGADVEIPDVPEPIVNGVIDLGQLAAEFLIMGIDPYPRKPGAVFELPAEPVDPEDHPFAALKALKQASKISKGKKPKGS